MSYKNVIVQTSSTTDGAVEVHPRVI